MLAPFLAVEFIGGPFDGFVEYGAFDDSTLPNDLIRSVSDAVFQAFDGRGGGTKSAPTSVAIYEKQHRGLNACYVFVGAIPPRQIDSLDTESDTENKRA